MSNKKAPKNNTNLKRALWVALVLFAIALTGLWTFEPEIIDIEKPVEPTGDVTTQVRIPLRKNVEQQSVINSSETATATATEGEQEQETDSTTPVIKKVTEDTVVQPTFITDLSHLIVTSYHPKGSHPAASKESKLLLDAKRINIHYGIEMTGLSWSGDDLAIGRQSVMRYALRPSMINALYALYKQRFVDAINTELNTIARSFNGIERTLTPEEQNAFYALTAKQLRATAGVLKSCAKVNSAMADIAVWLQAERDVLAANQRFQVALHDYQVSKEMHATQSVTDAAEAKMKAEGEAYEKAIRDREAYKAALANMIRKYKWTKNQDDETNLYIASWVFRRSKDLSNPKEVMMTIQDRLLDLANTMDSQVSL
ncbi:hypothetical protein [Halodesulfovibrio marinisediminis]|uniref:Uncharacterized protein n=1 Tax=Halodesulfovibrio marinisediminis DSM 17456 TaxID=1121457 RepID=A0A1N6IJK0_9BACT|nr:hypothetical protein [Halodesulfovibrio marinisediminis]SIO32166.1 hypothetical protein SAMN02745161_2810 [Halodesulfovibrio marinisediminis DSM 17456]